MSLSPSKGILRLLDPFGNVVDAFAWGNTSVAGMTGSLRFTSPGLIYERIQNLQGPVDTDRLTDWQTPRIHRIGESALASATVVVNHATLYASPDNAFTVLDRLIANATGRLHLHVYELTSLALADRLVAAKEQHPHLDLQVLVDGAPVGMSASDRHREAEALRRVQGAGGHVVVAGTTRYAHHHLKVLVADDSVAVQSENWVESGVPEDPSWGNRGWGAVLASAPLADWFAEWMHADRTAWDGHSFDLAAFDPSFQIFPRDAAPRTGAYQPVIRPLDIWGNLSVRVLVAPDATANPATDPIALLLHDAQKTVDTEQLEMSLAVSNPLGYKADDPFASALREAASRGVRVRVIAAPPFGSGPGSNQGVLDELHSASGFSPNLQTRLGSREGIATWHNKGLLVDNRYVVLGSLNAVHASRSANREVDVVLDSPAAAAYFGGLFASDWASGGTPANPSRDWETPLKDVRGLGLAPLPMLLALLGVAAALVRRP